MQIETKISKWGDGLATRITGAARDIPSFKLPFSEADLLKEMTSEKAHGDIIAHLMEGETI